jgi:hypothetical protein
MLKLLNKVADLGIKISDFQITRVTSKLGRGWSFQLAFDESRRRVSEMWSQVNGTFCE